MTMLRQLLDSSASADRIYHFTTTKVALEHILSEKTIRFSSLFQMNDPREFEYFAVSVGRSSDEDEAEFERLVGIAPKLIENIKQTTKIACFTVDQDSKGHDYKDIFDKGYCLPRMWSQYGESHSGVCFIFSREKLLRHVKEDVKAFHLPDGESFSTFNATVKYDNDIQKLNSALSLELPVNRNQTLETIMDERIETLLFNKYLDYAHEHEYRIALFSNHFSSKSSIPVAFGDSLEGIILGVRFKRSYEPSIAKLGTDIGVPVFRMTWKNGIPDLEAF
jgi:hypothetical protein